MKTPKQAPRILVALVTFTVSAPAQASDNVNFDRQIRPILTEHCYACHGPDNRQRRGGLRLDQQKATQTRLPSGRFAIVPGNPAASHVWQRITTSKASLRMPPVNSGRALNAVERELIRNWIQQGARWQSHWSYSSPVRPQLPLPNADKWPRQPIDTFVFASLDNLGLTPSTQETKHRLLRRVYFDVTGLPPTPDELQSALNNSSADSYERTVDRLLSLPTYGEHMAQEWLDLARYADTHGYHIDSHRDMWRWRDWVIDAFNSGMTYDQFTIEQIAGDLLPNANLTQRIATGFNRNNMVNFEGGALAEEYLVEYAVDRVNTTATVWLAQTMRCARCHDHKHDPWTQRDFFQLLAYFNRVPELGLDGKSGNAVPYIKAPTAIQSLRIASLNSQIKNLQNRMKRRATAVADTQRRWEQELATGKQKITQPANDIALHLPLEPVGSQVVLEAVSGDKIQTNTRLTWFPGSFSESLLFNGRLFLDLGTKAAFERTDSFSLSVWAYPTTADTMTLAYRGKQETARGSSYELQMESGNVAFRMVSRWPQNSLQLIAKTPVDLRQWSHIVATYDGTSRASGVTVYIDGERAELEVISDALTHDIGRSGTLRIGHRATLEPFRGMLDDLRIYPRILTKTEIVALANSNQLQQIVAISPADRTPQQQQLLQEYFLRNQDKPYQHMVSELEQKQRTLQRTRLEIPTTMVMKETGKPRDTFILARGDYREKLDRVQAQTPAGLEPKGLGLPNNRLGLAQWLVHPQHPLTSRVCVNRYWQHYFGRGIVLTSEDFGTRGERPSHPLLLDWIATEFVHQGWEPKKLQHSIVTSATYRQTARASTNQYIRDPLNRWLSRGPRKRRSAESIRDTALAVSGLLVGEIGGPSVYPYQPPGLWKEVSFNPRDFTAQEYKQSRGSNLYRRSIYTFWKRAVPPPALEAFGAPNRETCTARRIHDDTALQALVMMNDPAFVEAARELATKVLDRRARNNKQRIVLAYQMVLNREPTKPETTTLLKLLTEQLRVYQANHKAAQSLVQIGDSVPAERHPTAHLAAWTTLCNVLLGLDEAISN